jgi:hypothetical protein
VLLVAANSDSTFELGELFDGLGGSLSERVASETLNAVTSVISASLITTSTYAGRLRLPDLVQSMGDDTIPLLAQRWLALQEATRPNVGRAASLLASAWPLLVQLGYRELDRGLRSAEGGAWALLFAACAQDDARWNEAGSSDEFLMLLGRHFPVLDIDLRAQLVDAAKTRGNSAERLDRYRARDGLGALRNHLGTTELLALRSLEQELGAYKPERPSFEISEFDVSRQVAIQTEDLASLTAVEMLPFLRQSRHIEQARMFEPSVDSFAQQLRSLVPQRPLEFLDLVVQDSGNDFDAAVHRALVDGFAEAVKVGGLDSRLDDLLIYFERTGQSFQDTARRESSVDRSLAYALLTLAEAASQGRSRALHRPSVATAERLAGLLARLIETEGPSDPDGDTDLRFLSLNSSSGLAIRSSFVLLQISPGPRLLRSQLTGVLANRLEIETQPSNLCVYGQNMAFALVKAQPALRQSVKRLLGRRKDDPIRWSVVFGSYVADHYASPLDEKLFKDFSFAVATYGSSQSAHLRSNWAPVLWHAIYAYLRTGRDEWFAVVRRGLEVADSGDRGSALKALEQAWRRSSEPTPDEARLLNLLAHWAHAIEQQSEVQEASALARLVLASDLSALKIGALLLNLFRLGASVDPRRLLTRLSADVEFTPGLVAALLEQMSKGPQLDYWRLSESPLAARAAWNAVENLGRLGLFGLEESALRLQPMTDGI